MRRCLLSAAVVSLIAVAGCVPSLNAFFTAGDISFDKGLVGTWKQGGDKPVWTFSPHATRKQKYKVMLETEENSKRKTGEFVGTLFKLKGQTYLDLYPAGKPLKDDATGFYGFHIVPAHTLAKLDRKEGTLKLSFMNPEWTKKYLADHPDAIAHVNYEKDRVVLTAPTKKLQAFVAKHAGDEKAFMKPAELTKK